MKFFIDTANLDQIAEAQAMGILDGVTTNPCLLYTSRVFFIDKNPDFGEVTRDSVKIYRVKYLSLIHILVSTGRAKYTAIWEKPRWPTR